MTLYTDQARIESYLGVTLTDAQAAQAVIVSQAATDWIDRYLGRSWQEASPATEVLTVTGDTVWLSNRPVTAITSVQTRADVIGASYATLAAGQYELIDADAGQLQLIGWGNYLARVVYTHTATTPPHRIGLAATMIAASWMSQALRPSTSGVDSISVGQNDIALKFSASRGDVPAEALTLLGASPVVIA